MALEHNESALAELAKRKAESLSSGSPATGMDHCNLDGVQISVYTSACNTILVSIPVPVILY